MIRKNINMCVYVQYHWNCQGLVCCVTTKSLHHDLDDDHDQDHQSLWLMVMAVCWILMISCEYDLLLLSVIVFVFSSGPQEIPQYAWEIYSFINIPREATKPNRSREKCILLAWSWLMWVPNPTAARRSTHSCKQSLY